MNAATAGAGGQVDPFAGLSEIKTESLTFGKIGDWVKGTLTNISKAPSKFQAGRIENVYEFKAQGGFIHDEKGQNVNVDEGAFYTFWGKPQLDNAMRNIKVGQIFASQFVKTKPSTKGNPQKIFKVASGKMDPDYKGEDSSMQEQKVEDVPLND